MSGTVKAVEEQTANLPSDWLLWAAAFSLLASSTLFVAERKHASRFLRHWRPAVLLFGLYNKLVISGVVRQSMRRVP